LVEAAAPGSPAEAIRGAALTVGWALRRDAGAVDPVDLRREAWMRGVLREATASGAKAAAVVGAFHAPALLDADADAEAPADDSGSASWIGSDVTMSLIPYTYALLDSRSGYPAGIRDPEWQQSVLESGGDPAALHDALLHAAVRICTELRGQGHPSGPADAREIVRLAGDLARLRDLPAPGRGELLEAVQTVLTHGETLGRGRAVARALERVLVGTRNGRPAPAAPRSGLGPEVERRLSELNLPGPAAPAERDLRLDPLRSDLDRRRELLLQQLTTCRIPYGEPVAVTGAGGADAVTTRWRVRWTPSTAALLDATGARGVTPEQAAEGILQAQHRKELDDGGATSAQILTGLERAAACGLPTLTATRLTETATTLPTIATLPDLLTALTLTDRIHNGHFATATPPGPSARPETAPTPQPAAASSKNPTPDPDGTGPVPAAVPLSADLEGSAPTRFRDPEADQRPEPHDRPAGDGEAGGSGESGGRDHASGRRVGGEGRESREGDGGDVTHDVSQTLLTAAVRHLDGLTGSDDPADARALADLAARADTFGGTRLTAGLTRLAADGSPLIAAAAGAVRVLLGHEAPEALGDRIGSWLDTATTPATRAALTRRLVGLLTAAGPLLQTGGPVLQPLLDRVDTLPDRAFMDRLPALRGGFDTLSPAARDRVLDALADHLGDHVHTNVDPVELAIWTAADLAGKAAVTTRSLTRTQPTRPQPAAPNPTAGPPPTNQATGPDTPTTSPNPAARPENATGGAGG
ncbi:DUF5682 family protein, partial [Streptomyces sp. SID3343]|uniref:DUF5682 family protein n=1 Tax=Streptomyces sp. SID3343 TaxID=2690260 RepID=UPI0013C01EF7